MIVVSSVSATLAGFPCVIPDPVRFPAAGMANGFWCPLGPAPGRGWVVMLRQHLDALLASDPATVEFRLASQHVGGAMDEVVFPELLIERTRRLSPGPAGAPGSPHLVELTDKRAIVERFSDTGNVQWNVRSFAQSQTYLQGASGATWNSVVAALWNRMSFALGPFPGLPNQVAPQQPPENLRYTGASAWRALNRLLEKLACAVRYDPQADAFSIVALGESQADWDDVAATQVPALAEEPLENLRLKFPEKIRVYFPKRAKAVGQERDVELARNWLLDQHSAWIDVPTQVSHVVAGSILPIWDELPLVLDEDGQPENSSAIQSRAEHRAQRWLAAQRTSGVRRRLVLPRLVDAIAPGPQVKSVRWRLLGPRGGESGGAETEIVCHPGLPSALVDAFDGVRGRSSNDLGVDPYSPQHDALALGDENFAATALARQIPAVFPRVASVVQIRRSDEPPGAMVEPNADGLHPGVVRRWIAGELAELDPCWIRFVDDHDELDGQVSAKNFDCFGPGRLCGIETSQGETRPIYLVRRGGQGAAVRHGVVVDASSQIQPSPDAKYSGTLYAKEVVGPTADLEGGEPTLSIRVPHRKKIGDPTSNPSLAFCPSRFFLPDGSRIAFSAAADGALILVSDYDEWERFQIYYGKVVDSSGTPSGANPADTRDNPGVGLPKQVRLLVIDYGTGDPLAAPHVGKRVWVGVSESAAAAVTVGSIVAFRSYVGSPLHENIAIWDRWDESTTGLVAVAGLPSGVGPCVAIECQATVGTREVSDDHTGELRIRRGKATPENPTKRRRELRIGLSMRGQAKVVAGKPDLCGLKLPGLPPSTLESFGHSSAAATPRLWRHLVVEGAGSPAAPRFDFVELDWTAPGLSGYLYFWHIVVSTSHFPTQLDLLQHWVLFDRGVLVNRGWGPGKWRVTTTYWADAYPGGPEWVGFTPRATAQIEPWPNNCCDG